MTPPLKKPASPQHPDENTHPTLDDDILNEGKEDPTKAGKKDPDDDEQGFDNEEGADGPAPDEARG